MNKQQYLLRKKSLIIEKSRQLCLKCRRPEVACLCEDLISFETKTHFVILMHPKEAKKEKIGTGRLSHLILKNSEIIVGENFDHNQRVQEIISDKENECFILYPGPLSHNISEEKLEVQKKLIIFVVDGTWPCAKSMMRDSKTLHHLPRISFTLTKESLFKIKQQPSKDCLSTIESFYYLLEGLKRSELEDSALPHQTLLKTLDKLVDFQIKCAQDPSKNHYRRKSHGYKLPTLRKPSKKHIQRKITFDPLNYS